MEPQFPSVLPQNVVENPLFPIFTPKFELGDLLSPQFYPRNGSLFPQFHPKMNHGTQFSPIYTQKWIGDPKMRTQDLVLFIYTPKWTWKHFFSPLIYTPKNERRSPIFPQFYPQNVVGNSIFPFLSPKIGAVNRFPPIYTPKMNISSQFSLSFTPTCDRGALFPSVLPQNETGKPNFPSSLPRK